MKSMPLKKDVSVLLKKNIYYLTDETGNPKRYKPWLGDIFAFLYDKIMEKSIFPKKFKGSINKHFEILKNEFKDIHGYNVLEIAAGSGNAVNFLNNDNKYTGIDISPGLLKIAYSKFKKYGFKDIELYNANANQLPFRDNTFNFAFCNLSLNFFDDIEAFLQELKRVLKSGSAFFCSVPVPERKAADSKIRGTLYSQEELSSLFKKYNFNFESKAYKNGAVLYFSAILTAINKLN